MAAESSLPLPTIKHSILHGKSPLILLYLNIIHQIHNRRLLYLNFHKVQYIGRLLLLSSLSFNLSHNASALISIATINSQGSTIFPPTIICKQAQQCMLHLQLRSGKGPAAWSRKRSRDSLKMHRNRSSSHPSKAARPAARLQSLLRPAAAPRSKNVPAS